MKFNSANLPQGLSLFSLLITLSIIAILSLIAWPYFVQYRARIEYNNLYYMLYQHIRFAQTQAELKQQDVVICSSQDLQHCQDQQWNNGLMIYIDRNKDRNLTNDEDIVLRLKTDIQYGKLSWLGNATHQQQLVFQGDTGLPRGSNGRFRYCSFYNAQFNLDLILSPMGHLRKISKQIC